MLLTVSEVEGLSDGMEELSDEEMPSAVASSTSSGSKQLPAHPSVVMVSGQGFLLAIHNNTVTYGMSTLLWLCVCQCVFAWECGDPCRDALGVSKVTLTAYSLQGCRVQSVRTQSSVICKNKEMREPQQHPAFKTPTCKQFWKHWWVVCSHHLATTSPWIWEVASVSSGNPRPADHVEIRALWGLCHLLQSSLFFLTMKIL